MLNDVSPILVPARPVAQTATEATPVPAEGTGVASASSQDALTRTAVEPSQALDRASRAAVRAMFPGREVEISSFHDEGAGRVVYRVADRSSGEVLLQSPPDALLRFFASARAALAEPLLSVEA
jgi:hypothetical protein